MESKACRSKKNAMFKDCFDNKKFEFRNSNFVNLADVVPWTYIIVQTKGGFFQKVRFFFQITQSPKKNIPKSYPELEI